MELTFINNTSGYGAGSATSIAATAASHTAGNLLVVFVSWLETAAISSITDTAGNTYTKIIDFAGDGFAMYYAKNISGNANNVVQANWASGQSYREISVQQWSGADISSPLDVSNSGSGSGTSMSTGASDTTVNDEVIIAGYNTWEVGTYTPGTNFDERYDGNYHGTESRVVSSIGSYGSTMTVSPSTDWWGLHATFKQAVEGEGTLTKRVVALCG
jgi:hypothetical protein